MSGIQVPDRLRSIVSDFPNRRVLVLGDAILDEYLSGDCNRISPEAPVPVLRVRNTRRVLGGAANTAANLAALGAEAILLSLVADDDAGAALARCARDAGVTLHPIRTTTPTLRKTRVVSQHQQIVRLDYEEIAAAGTETVAPILVAFEQWITQVDILVLSDYAKGFFTKHIAQTVMESAHRAGRLVVVDPRPEHRDFYTGCDYITPNWKEARGLLGLRDQEPSSESVRTVREDLAAALGSNIVLTLGAGGISFCSRTGEEQFSMPTLAREVFDVSGAGDTVVATLALALASGADHATALELANKAASVVVAKFGTATLTREELLGDDEGVRLVGKTSLQAFGQTARAKGKRLVAVTGMFDTLDRRQIHLLDEARARGDLLIVGLYGDAWLKTVDPRSARATELDRADMLLKLRSVDYVHILEASDPSAFVNTVAADVHVSAADFEESSSATA